MPYSSLTQRPNDKETTIHGRVLGSHIRDAMARAKLSGKAMARLLGASESFVSRVVTGKTVVDSEEVSAIMALCGVGGERRKYFVQMARDRDVMAWTRDDQLATWRSLMAEAFEVDEYGQSTIPDMLRTRGYDHAVLTRTVDVDPESIGERLTTSETARELMLNVRAAKKRRYRVVLAEQVLHTPVGSREVMAEQLNLLLRLSVRSGISLCVIPGSVGEHVGLRGSFCMAACSDITAACTGDELNLHLMDHPDAVAHYTPIFSALMAIALPPSESRALIGRVAVQVHGSKPLLIERPFRPVEKAVSV